MCFAPTRDVRFILSVFRLRSRGRTAQITHRSYNHSPSKAKTGCCEYHEPSDAERSDNVTNVGELRHPRSQATGQPAARCQYTTVAMIVSE